ncbi:DUF2924 domain-containing protein [Qipengyuania sp.]
MGGDIEKTVASLQTMDLDDLRSFWRKRFGKPPALRSEPILRQLLAWRVQVQAFGGLDAQTLGALGRTGPVLAEGRQLGVGARLTRQWKGREVTVTVEEEGFRWEDRVFPSLSAAATAIAGSRWNGPRFFGLRDN